MSTLAVFLLVLRYFFQAYVVPLHRLEEDIEALALGAPEARVDAAGAEAAGRLAGGLNRLMERYEDSEARVEERVAEATASVDAEMKQLGTVLDSLGQGVIVCDAAGVVVRYNRTARSLLEPSHEPRLGRPVYGIVEKELCDYALETIAAQLAAGVGHPSVEFSAERAAGDPLWGRITPVAGDDAPLHGFVLTLEETTRPLSSTELLPAVRVRFHTDPEHALLRELRFVVFDTETTGLNPSKGDEIISIGAVVVAQGRIVAEEVFETLVNPGIPVSAASTKIHGLTNDDLARQPGIDEALALFARFTEEAVLVASQRILRHAIPQAQGGRHRHRVAPTRALHPRSFRHRSPQPDLPRPGHAPAALRHPPGRPSHRARRCPDDRGASAQAPPPARGARHRHAGAGRPRLAKQPAFGAQVLAASPDPRDVIIPRPRYRHTAPHYRHPGLDPGSRRGTGVGSRSGDAAPPALDPGSSPG